MYLPYNSDAVIRIPIVAWWCVLAMWSMVGLYWHVIAEANNRSVPTLYPVSVGMRLSVIIFLIMIAVTTLSRIPAAAKTRGAEPRISAVIGTVLATAMVMFPRRELSTAASVISMFVVAGGNLAAGVILIQLRDAFSIMPEARCLVTTGAYRIVRHPLYLAEGTAALGVLMQFLSVWTITLLIIQFGFQLRRMVNEELLLMKTFPEYGAYKARTARIIPGIY